jgi:putative membrane protein
MSVQQPPVSVPARPVETVQPSINGAAWPAPLPPATPRVRRTRASAAWFDLCATAVALVLLIIFMLQNTRGVEVAFLGLNGTVPLALALLIAAVAAALLTMGIAVVRMTQLRRTRRRP